MTAETLPRKDRLALKARASKFYGAPGDAGLAIHEAYHALRGRDVATATRLASQISRDCPDNAHPWLIMGMVALDRMEGATAEAFFKRAHEIAPKNPEALSGLGKARVFMADVEAAVDLFERAMEAGSEDLAMVRLYHELMSRLDRKLDAARVMIGVARRMRDAGLYHTVGELFLDAEEYSDAIEALREAYELDPDALENRVGRIKQLFFEYDYETLVDESETLLAEHPEYDELINLRMAGLRNLARYDEALSLLDSEFSSAVYYKRALGVAAHVHLDRGDSAQAGLAFRDAVHVTDEDPIWAAKGYGTHCFAEGDYVEGAKHYAERQTPSNRAKIPYEYSAPEKIGGRTRLFVMKEQGVGDQFALLPLVQLAPLAEGAEITFVGDARMAAVLEGNALGVRVWRETDLEHTDQVIQPDEMVFMGDLTRYLPARGPQHRFGGYLRPDPARVSAMRDRYRALAGDGPVVGLSWFTRDGLTGHRRSVALSDLVAQLAPGTLAVNLQYGDHSSEIAAAAKARPDVTVFQDPEVDQLTDMVAFAAQIMALDRVITIDNTTAHTCGALGHPDTHVLLPSGAECMWYWQRKGDRDPWFGNLTLHRQATPRDWSRPLAEIAAL